MTFFKSLLLFFFFLFCMCVLRIGSRRKMLDRGLSNSNLGMKLCLKGLQLSLK